MYRLIIVLLLTGCVTSKGSVQYNVTTEYDSQGNIIKTTEMWDGRSSVLASGDAGLEASQKEIDFGIEMPTATVHLKAKSNIKGIQSQNSQQYMAIMSILIGIPNEEKAAALRALSNILEIP